MKPQIVVVDDNALMRLLVQDALQPNGYHVVAFENAAEALAALGREVPAAYLVDQEMPGMSGAAFIRELRHAEDPRVRNVPVVGLTAGSDAELMGAGADACLKKPFTESMLLRSVRGVLHGRADEGPSLASLIARFGALHAQARHGTLDAGRAHEYAAMRSELVRALLAIQDAFVKSPPPRGTLRIQESLPIVVSRSGRRFDTLTSDVGTGGFAISIDAVLAYGDTVEFELQLPGGRATVSGTGRVANVSAEPGAAGRRVGFAFARLADPEDTARIEGFVLDRILARLSSLGTGAPASRR